MVKNPPQAADTRKARRVGTHQEPPSSMAGKMWSPAAADAKASCAAHVQASRMAGERATSTSRQCRHDLVAAKATQALTNITAKAQALQQALKRAHMPAHAHIGQPHRMQQLVVHSACPWHIVQPSLCARVARARQCPVIRGMLGASLSLASRQLQPESPLPLTEHGVHLSMGCMCTWP